MARWLAPGVGVGVAGGVLVTAVQHAALGPILVIVGVLGGLPLALIITLSLVAVYSPHRTRRGAAEKILDRLLSVLTPPPRP